MGTLERIFSILAASCIFYAVFLYISFAVLKREDEGRSSKVLHFISYSFLILGLGGAAIFGPIQLLDARHRRERHHEAMKLVKFITETNRMDEFRREAYWEKHRFLYKTELDYDTWKRSALREYGYYYNEFFQD